MAELNKSDGDVLASADTDDIDEQLVIQCTSGARPTGVNGRVVSETDTGNISRYDGSTWRKFATVGATIGFGTAFTPGTTHVVNVGNATSSVRNIASNADNTASRNHMTFYNPNGAVGTINTNGTATAYNTSSDIRLKEDQGPLTGALDLIRRVVIHRFRWRRDGTEDVGVFAQELHEVIPTAVTVGGDNPHADPWSVDYSRLVPTLLAAVQELEARVAELEAR